MTAAHGFNLVTFFKNLARNSPWVIMAIAFHVILFGVAAVAVFHKSAPKEEEVVTAIKVSGPKEDVLPEIVEPPEVIDRKAIPKNEEAELVTFEEDVYIPTSEPQQEDLRLNRGDPNAIDNLPSGGTTGGTAIGVGEGGHHGTGRPSPFGGRKIGSGAPKGRAGGPTQGTEKAVLEGLRWLARHQNPDGSWSLASLPEHCDAERPCYQDEKALTSHYDEGLTGLSLLCFLGAGFSHESKQDLVDTTRAKRYKIGEIIKNGLTWLAKRQNQDGSFSKDRAFMYNEALAGMAMCEAYGLTQNRYWKGPAQKSIDFLQNAQRPSPDGQGLWGWRYESRMEVEDYRRTGSDDAEYKQALHDSDTSVTTWCVMALKSAQLSGLEVKPEAMAGAMKFCTWVTGGEGLVGYTSPTNAGATVTGDDDYFIYHPTTMSALGMCLRIFSQHDPDDPFLELAAKQIIKDLPKDNKDKKNPSLDYYYWYYASLALNQLDGPDSPRKSGKYWGPWNKAMVETVVALQTNADRSCNNGGWIQPDRWAHSGGCIYTTAINILTLEVYYRYENAFGGAKREKK